jgi:hypothetical protein
MNREERATKFVTLLLHSRFRHLAADIVRETLPTIESEPLPEFYKQLGTATFRAMRRGFSESSQNQPEKRVARV